jgi:hypothetical protein
MESGSLSCFAMHVRLVDSAILVPVPFSAAANAKQDAWERR